MSAPDFTSILNKSVSDVEKPKPLPVGTYLCMVNGNAEFTKIGQKETPAAIFQLKPLQPQDDVDREALADVGEWSNRAIRHTMFLSEDALYRLKEFLGHLGFDTGGHETLSQLLAQVPGKQCMVQVGHRPSPDGQQLYVEVKKTASV